MTKWAYFMTLFAGAAVCVWLVLLNTRIATQSSSTGREPEKPQKSGPNLKEQFHDAELKVDVSRKMEILENRVIVLTEQLASERQLMQNLLEMVLNNSRANAALTPGERKALELGLKQVRQAQEARSEETISP